MSLRFSTKTVATAIAGVSAAVCVGAIGGIVVRGVSARDAPTAVEAVVARTLRRLAIPLRERESLNPVVPTAEILTRARRHFADHCASCHGNDGSAARTIGQWMYPRAPDMRAAETQSLTDGELYWIIRNGIRLTGMPAWGNPDTEPDLESWGLVHWLRRLPVATEEEIEEMKRWNPISREGLEREIEIETYLKGGRAGE